MRLTPILIVAFMLQGCGAINLTPVQEKIKMALMGEPEPAWISSEKIEELLPSFAEVGPGVYKLVPRGLVARMHDAPWCAPGASEILRPKNWVCTHYTKQVVDKMKGYACGKMVRKYKEENHMQLICIGEESEILIYEPQSCQWDFVKVKDVLYIKMGIGK